MTEALGATYSHHDHLGAHQPLGPVASAREVPFGNGEECDPRKDAKDDRKIGKGGETAFAEDMADYMNGHYERVKLSAEEEAPRNSLKLTLVAVADEVIF